MPSTAERFLALFRGNKDAHGTYLDEEFSEGKKKQEIKKTARTVYKTVTTTEWTGHLAGEYHLGIITITEDSNCWWAAVDIDDYSVDHMEVVRRLEAMRVPSLVCRTKSGGAHCYVFFSEPIPAVDVMPKMRELAAALGYGDSEVFPKQTQVVTEQRGLGNWLNMPYFGGDRTKSYAYGKTGSGLSLGQFLDAAEKGRMTATAFRRMQLTMSVEGWEDCPPCLEYLAGTGVGQGIQNNALFSFGVLAKKKDSEGWEDLLRQWNNDLFRPPHPAERVAQVVASLKKREYNYKCKDAPCVSHCNMTLCRTRLYGIGPGGGADIIDSVSVVATEPPTFYVLLKTGGTVECTSGQILNPREFQRCALDQVQLVFPQFKIDTWLPQVQRAIEGATIIEVPSEVGTTGQLMELVERFCTDMHAAEDKDGLLLGKPWLDDASGRVYFRLRDLADFLDRNKFRDLTRSQVTERIKKMGGGPEFFNLRGKGVNVWYVPSSELSWLQQQVDIPDSQESPL